MNHDALIEEARELARGKKTAELAEMAFIYAYVANHEVRMVFWLLLTIGVPMALMLLGILTKMILGG